MTDLSEGDEVLVRGHLHNYIDGNPHMEVPDIAEEGFERIDIVTPSDAVVPLALVRALVQDVIAVGTLYDAPGAWDAKENAARILAAKARTLLTAAPWLGEECYICNRRFAKNGETPTVWEETICGWFTGEECPMEASFCVPIGQSRKRTTA